MNSSVIIKGNKYGIVVVMDENAEFDEIKAELVKKISDSAKFFNNASIAISFSGKELSSAEEKEIIDLITENSTMNIVCVMDNNAEVEDKFKTAVDKATVSKPSTEGQFYKGTLRSGQIVESESSIIILGDINPGARVISGGNVIVLGALKGTVYAGANGVPGAFVVALEMSPVQIRIGDIIARSGDDNKRFSKPETKIAYVDGENIYIEPLNKEVLNDIKF